MLSLCWEPVGSPLLLKWHAVNRSACLGCDSAWIQKHSLSCFCRGAQALCHTVYQGDLIWCIAGLQIAATAFVVAWAVRLGGFLVVRVWKTGHDSRFDEAKHQPFKFWIYWTMQVCLVGCTAVWAASRCGHALSALKLSARSQQQWGVSSPWPSAGQHCVPCIGVSLSCR